MGGESRFVEKVLYSTVFNNLGSVGSGLLQAGIVDEVSMDDMDVGTLA